jgi:DNA-binding transcriptional regulator YdaS (Cro superfamily)
MNEDSNKFKIWRDYALDAVEMFDGYSNLAKVIQVDRKVLWNMINRDKSLPPEIALQIEKATNKKITFRKLMLGDAK